MLGMDGDLTMKISQLGWFEIIMFSGLWTLLLFAPPSAFKTIMFFEPEFTIAIIAFSILTGMLIGGIIERYLREKAKSG